MFHSQFVCSNIEHLSNINEIVRQFSLESSLKLMKIRFCYFCRLINDSRFILIVIKDVFLLRMLGVIVVKDVFLLGMLYILARFLVGRQCYRGDSMCGSGLQPTFIP